MFLDMRDMPAQYEHLRTRLRVEPVRCLNWGAKVGLVEDLLEEPSKLLELNGSLLQDVLLQIRQTFRARVWWRRRGGMLVAGLPEDAVVKNGRPVSAASKMLLKMLRCGIEGGGLLGGLLGAG